MRLLVNMAENGLLPDVFGLADANILIDMEEKKND